MKTIEIEIPEEVRDHVQRCDIECSSRRDIIMQILTHDYNITQERINQCWKDYEEKFYNFEQAKSNLEKNYIFTNIKKENLINWYLDYQSCIITVQVEENNV